MVFKPPRTKQKGDYKLEKLKTKELIEKIKKNITLHLNPYNLGDMGETTELIYDALGRLEKLVMLQKCWTQQKPDYACIFVTKHSSEYNIWRFCWEIGEPPEDATDTDDTVHWYLAWTNQDGDEWDDIAECDFDEYLILEILPTMDEAHKQWCEKQSKAFLST